jgi:hypothetical protein
VAAVYRGRHLAVGTACRRSRCQNPLSQTSAAAAAGWVWSDHRARRPGPREHGRQAARSKRVRPERARKMRCQASHVRAAAGGALIH